MGKTGSKNLVENIKKELNIEFTTYRKSGVIDRMGRVREYPENLQKACQRAISLGISKNDVAVAAGVSTNSIDRWILKPSATPKNNAAKPSIQILNIEKPKQPQNPSLVLNIPGIRIEIHKEDSDVSFANG